MLKKDDAVSGTIIQFNDILKDIGGNVVPYVTFMPDDEGFDIGGTRTNGIMPNAIATILDGPNGKNINCAKLEINGTIGYCFWIDVKKNSTAMSVGYKKPVVITGPEGPFYIRDANIGQLYAIGYNKELAYLYEKKAKNGTAINFSNNIQVLYVSKRSDAKKLKTLKHANDYIKLIVNDRFITKIPDSWEIVRYDTNTKEFAETYSI